MVQNGAMRFPGLIWRLRRLIVAIAALMVLSVSLDLHPGSAHVAAAPTVVTHSHDADGDNGAEISHKSMHHDHHTEFAILADVDVDARETAHEGRPFRDLSRRVSIALDRPPDAARG